MSGEDHERFEAYLELERYIAELQAGRVAHPPDELTPSQLRMYQMAALLRSASSEEATPRPEFVAALQILLEQELRQPAPTKRTFPFLPQKRPRISRRALLTGGAAVAASLVIGAGIERVVEESRTGSPDSAYPPLVPSGIPTTWYFVTTLANLGASAVRFATDTIVGHVIRDVDDGGDPNEGRVIALSAACTHMGCIVDWQDADRKFHCPCHGGLFSAYGQVDTSAGPVRYLRPLPQLETKVEEGGIYVKVPVSRTRIPLKH